MGKYILSFVFYCLILLSAFFILKPSIEQETANFPTIKKKRTVGRLADWHFFCTTRVYLVRNYCSIMLMHLLNYDKHDEPIHCFCMKKHPLLHPFK